MQAIISFQPIFPSKLLTSPAKLQTLQKLQPPTKLHRGVPITAVPAATHNLVPPQPPPPRPPPPTPPALSSETEAFWDYQFLFVSQRSETVNPVTLCTIDGKIPYDFPTGTYYLTGPGIFSDDHGSTVHPLDGHGYLRAFSINGVSGEVKFSAKYIKTEAQIEEFDMKSGTWKFTHRGPFSVLKGGKKIGNTKVMKNVANTSIVKWSNRLLCFWEGGFPYEIDQSGCLDTIGKFDFCGFSPGNDVVDENVRKAFGGFWALAAQVLKPFLIGIFKMPPKRLLSHYKIDPILDRLLLVSCNAEDMLLPHSTFTFYEYDSEFKLLQKQEFDIPDHLMIHDWAFTETHYILFANRIKLNVTGSMLALSGLSPMISALSVNSNKSTSPIYLLPRFPSKVCIKRDWKVAIEAPSQMWALHIGNAFEEIDQNGKLNLQIHIIVCSYRWFNFQKMFGYDWKKGKLDPSFMNARDSDEDLLPHLVKVSIKLNEDGNDKKCEVEALNNWNEPSDFPAINPRFSGTRSQFIYTATTSTCQNLPYFPFDTIAKLDISNGVVSTWSVGKRRFIGEPVFVPKGIHEDDGYILVIEYAVAIQRCYLVILNPKKIGKSDTFIARLEVPKHLNFPLGFHGYWAANDS